MVTSEEFVFHREQLISQSLAWESAFGKSPSITGELGEIDAIFSLGFLTPETLRKRRSASAVKSKSDFEVNGLRYQVKANRPSGRPGSKVTKIGVPKPDGWDELLWVLYNKDYRVQEFWKIDHRTFWQALGGNKHLRPKIIRDSGIRLSVPFVIAASTPLEVSRRPT